MAEILVGASVDANEVREIVDTDLTDARLNNFINMAYLMVSSLSLTSTNLIKQLELLLSAHYLSVYDGVVQSMNVAGEYSVTYGMVIGEGLLASPYGQQAVSLDTSGKLAKLGLKRAKFLVTSHYDIFGSTYLQQKVDEGDE